MNYQNNIVKNFDCLRRTTLWAAALGVVQSLLWIGLTLTGILSYSCLIPLPDKITFGTIIQYVFFDVYFKGNCQPDGYQSGSANIALPATVLDPTQILIWTCVYLGVAVCWLLSSVLMVTHVKKDNAKMTVGIIFTWTTLTLIICLMDLALGIIFGIDYGNFKAESNNWNLDSGQSGVINPYAIMFVAGEVAAISLMIISFKGFILWIVNASLLMCLKMRAVRIMHDKDGNDTLFMPRKDSDDILTTRPPINAYDNIKPNGYQNEAFAPDNHYVDTTELNQEAIARAARMSTDASLQDRRFRNLDNFQQYPPPRNNNNNYRQESMKQQPEVVIEATVVTAPYPAPDYSPPMTRANQSNAQNGLLRNQRYQ